MPILCPHLFQQYLSKANEIIDIYHPQIVNVVPYTQISNSMIKYKVLKSKENKFIMEFQQNKNRMEQLLLCIKTRMWGLENLIKVIIEEKIDNWLADTLFQAYVRHLVTNMKKLQHEKICECFQTGSTSLFQYSWYLILEKLDNWLVDIGTSLECFAVPTHPVKVLLDFIRNRLNMKFKTETIETLTQFRRTMSEDSEESDAEYHEENPNVSQTPTSTNPESNELCLEYEDDVFSIHEEDHDDKISQTTSDSEEPELVWDNLADPHFYNTLSKHTEYILKLIEETPVVSKIHDTKTNLNHESCNCDQSNICNLIRSKSTWDVANSRKSFDASTQTPSSPVLWRVRAKSVPRITTTHNKSSHPNSLYKQTKIQHTPRSDLQQKKNKEKSESEATSAGQVSSKLQNDNIISKPPQRRTKIVKSITTSKYN